MAYEYGHEKTAYNGVCLWLQRNLNGLKENRDTNQLFSAIDKIMVEYLKSIGKDPIKFHYKSGRINTIRTAQIIQKEFSKFANYVRENQEYLKDLGRK